MWCFSDYDAKIEFQGENFSILSSDRFDANGRSSFCDLIRFQVGRGKATATNPIVFDGIFCAELNSKRQNTKPNLFSFMVHVQLPLSLFSLYFVISPHKMTNDLMCGRLGLSGHCRKPVNLNSIGRHVIQRENTC